MIIEIDKRFFKSNQSWCYTRIITLKIQKAKFSEHSKAVTYDEHKLKAEIRRNAYDDQSDARCYKFDGNKWNLVCSIPIKDCECQVVSYVCKKIDARKDLFFQDSQTLFEIAKKIIS